MTAKPDTKQSIVRCWKCKKSLNFSCQQESFGKKSAHLWYNKIFSAFSNPGLTLPTPPALSSIKPMKKWWQKSFCRMQLSHHFLFFYGEKYILAQREVQTLHNSCMWMSLRHIVYIAHYCGMYDKYIIEVSCIFPTVKWQCSCPKGNIILTQMS